MSYAIQQEQESHAHALHQERRLQHVVRIMLGAEVALHLERRLQHMVMIMVGAEVDRVAISPERPHEICIVRERYPTQRSNKQHLKKPTVMNETTDSEPNFILIKNHLAKSILFSHSKLYYTILSHGVLGFWGFGVLDE